MEMDKRTCSFVHSLICILSMCYKSQALSWGLGDSRVLLVTYPDKYYMLDSLTVQELGMCFRLKLE